VFSCSQLKALLGQISYGLDGGAIVIGKGAVSILRYLIQSMKYWYFLLIRINKTTKKEITVDDQLY
jgi:hypothetical protein